MIKVLVTGKNSYIGNSFYDYIKNNYHNEYQVDKISLKDTNIENIDLCKYDTVFHVAGIAHSDFGKISEEKSKEYYKVNTDSTIHLAKKAKEQKVKQFIFMSSIIVYGDSSPIGVKKIITNETAPCPINAYGDSKLKAEDGLKLLNNDKFKVAIVRAPLIYGEKSKGNYKTLETIAINLPFFPYVENERSVISINNLCKYIKQIIDKCDTGIYFPQDDEYMNTSLMVKKIANHNDKEMILIHGLTPPLRVLSKFIPQINKAFGNFVYDKTLKYLDL